MYREPEDQRGFDAARLPFSWMRAGFPTLLRRTVLVLTALLLLPGAVIAIYRFVPSPATPLMLIRAVGGDGAERKLVSLDTLPSEVSLAMLAAEDNRFCQHHGFDWLALGDAVDDARRGERLRGASTISMQLGADLRCDVSHLKASRRCRPGADCVAATSGAPQPLEVRLGCDFPRDRCKGCFRW